MKLLTSVFGQALQETKSQDVIYKEFNQWPEHRTNITLPSNSFLKSGIMSSDTNCDYCTRIKNLIHINNSIVKSINDIFLKEIHLIQEEFHAKHPLVNQEPLNLTKQPADHVVN